MPDYRNDPDPKKRDLYEKEGLVILEARPSEGFEFIGWAGDVDGIADTTQSTVTVTMSSDRAIVANFTAPGDLYTVTLETSPYWAGSAVVEAPCGSFATDSIQPTISMQFLGGTELHLMAMAAEGYTFRGWKGDLSGVEDVTFVVESDMTITACFSRSPSFPWGWVAGGVLALGVASIVVAKFTVWKGRKRGETPDDGGSPAQPS